MWFCMALIFTLITFNEKFDHADGKSIGKNYTEIENLNGNSETNLFSYSTTFYGGISEQETLTKPSILHRQGVTESQNTAYNATNTSNTNYEEIVNTLKNNWLFSSSTSTSNYGEANKTAHSTRSANVSLSNSKDNNILQNGRFINGTPLSIDETNTYTDTLQPSTNSGIATSNSKYSSSYTAHNVAGDVGIFTTSSFTDSSVQHYNRITTLTKVFFPNSVTFTTSETSSNISQDNAISEVTGSSTSHANITANNISSVFETSDISTPSDVIVTSSPTSYSNITANISSVFETGDISTHSDVIVTSSPTSYSNITANISSVLETSGISTLSDVIVTSSPTSYSNITANISSVFETSDISTPSDVIVTSSPTSYSNITANISSVFETSDISTPSYVIVMSSPTSYSNITANISSVLETSDISTPSDVIVTSSPTSYSNITANINSVFETSDISTPSYVIVTSSPTSYSNITANISSVTETSDVSTSKDITSAITNLKTIINISTKNENNLFTTTTVSSYDTKLHNDYDLSSSLNGIFLFLNQFFSQLFETIGVTDSTSGLNTTSYSGEILFDPVETTYDETPSSTVSTLEESFETDTTKTDFVSDSDSASTDDISSNSDYVSTDSDTTFTSEITSFSSETTFSEGSEYSTLETNSESSETTIPSTETTFTASESTSTSEVSTSESSETVTPTTETTFTASESTSTSEVSTSESSETVTPTTETSFTASESTSTSEVSTSESSETVTPTIETTFTASETTSTSEVSTNSNTTTVTPPTEITTPLSTSTEQYSSTPETGAATGDEPPTATVIGVVIGVLAAGIVGVVLYMSCTGKLNWSVHKFFGQSRLSVQPDPIPVKKFAEHCEQLLGNISRLSSEYTLLGGLSSDLPSKYPVTAAELPDNRKKNRYKNILPYDATRVKLDIVEGDSSTDYINASYIKGYSGNVEYIAAQGPKEETFSDFYRMVMQCNVQLIIMVTQFEEDNKVKCDYYFPTELRETMTIGDFVIRCATLLSFPDYTERSLVIHKGGRKKTVKHLHFLQWPDFGCPSDPGVMLRFCQTVREQINDLESGLTVVHCSAGVGRTGTLIALDILLQNIKDGKKIDIFGTVFDLRHQRYNMVQTQAQYKFIYESILKAVQDPTFLKSDKSKSSSSLEPIYENLMVHLRGQSYDKLTKGLSTGKYNIQKNGIDENT